MLRKGQKRSKNVKKPENRDFRENTKKPRFSPRGGGGAKKTKNPPKVPLSPLKIARGGFSKSFFSLFPRVGGGRVLQMGGVPASDFRWWYKTGGFWGGLKRVVFWG